MIEKKIVIALFGAPRGISAAFTGQLQVEFGPPHCAVLNLEDSVKDAARSIFGIDAATLAWHPEDWGEEKVYGKSINKLLRATMNFGAALDPGIWVDRCLDHMQYMGPGIPFVIVRDGRTIQEWKILQERKREGMILVGVLVKRGVNSFPEDEFDLSVDIKDAQEDMAPHVGVVAEWVRELRGAASSS